MPNPSTSGYSGTPLAGRLGIRPSHRVHLINAPVGYLEQLEPLPQPLSFASRLSPKVDLVQLFADRRSVLQTQLVRCRERLAPDATLWVSWPKKASKVPTDITEDVIRELALPLGWVDVKVCAVDAVWSGLKLVVRKALR